MPSSDSYNLDDYLGALKRRSRMITYVSLPIVAIALSLALLLPDTFDSSARIDINLEGEKVRTLEPITVANYADQYVGKLRNRVMAYQNISILAKDETLFPGELSKLSHADRVRLINKGTYVKFVTQKVMDGGGRTVDLIAGFRTGYKGPNPKFATGVATFLSGSFLKEDRSIRTERASSTSAFLSDQIQITENEIVELEKEIATFKVEHACCLPELKGLNMNVIERAERDIEDLRPRIRELEQDRVFVQSQIDEIRKQSSSTDRLAILEEEYASLVANYGPDHPDVARVRREIAALGSIGAAGDGGTELAELKLQLAEKERRYSDIHPDVISLRRRISTLEADRTIKGQGSRDNRLDDPRYLQLRNRVNDIDTELQTLRTRMPQLLKKIGEYEDRLTQTPQIESEYLGITRKLETARQNFDNLQGRLVIARQTEALESTEIGARLTEIAAPFIPTEPAGPPRLAISILGMFLALTLGIGWVIVAELMDKTVRSAQDIIRTIQIVPIAAIPTAHMTDVNTSDMRRRIIVSATALLVIVAIVYFAAAQAAQL